MVERKSSLQALCWIYALVLLGAASLNYVPGLTDQNGLAFGIFQLDLYDDALHVASALWAVGAALSGPRAARTFALIFGAAYLADGVLGVWTGYGFLDLGIFTNPRRGPSFSFGRVAANLPHLGLGGLALAAGLRRKRL